MHIYLFSFACALVLAFFLLHSFSLPFSFFCCVSFHLPSMQLYWINIFFRFSCNYKSLIEFSRLVVLLSFRFFCFFFSHSLLLLLLLSCSPLLPFPFLHWCCRCGWLEVYPALLVVLVAAPAVDVFSSECRLLRLHLLLSLACIIHIIVDVAEKQKENKASARKRGRGNTNELLSEPGRPVSFVYLAPRDCFIPHSVWGGRGGRDSSNAAGAWGWVISSVVQGQDRTGQERHPARPSNTRIIKSD